MNLSAHLNVKFTAAALAAATSLLLTACGGAGGGGQDPDPVVVDLPIAYISRSLPVDEDGDPSTSEALNPQAFNPGATLFLKDRATASANVTNITNAAFAEDEALLYDVKDMAVSADGQKIIFAMRAPELEDVDEEDQPRWNIWEYARDTATLRRIISSDNNAEAGQDVDPHYLPDGRIVFSSDRQRRSRSILLDDNKPQYSGLTEARNTEAFVLHVMDEDGSDIEQITFNQSHDLQPTVLADGRILFNRWDNISGKHCQFIHGNA